jgi:hypothetical protein
MSALDVYRITDELDDDMSEVLAARLEARGKHPVFLRMLEQYLAVPRLAGLPRPTLADPSGSAVHSDAGKTACSTGGRDGAAHGSTKPTRTGGRSGAVGPRFTRTVDFCKGAQR